MNKKVATAAVIDGILRLGVSTAAIGSVLVLPGLLVAVDKPLSMFDKKMDQRAKERELRRILSYMKRTKLLESQRYEHGITITDKGRKRLEKQGFDQMQINQPETWDNKWRLVIFDVPETKKVGRNALSAKLRELGFKTLQRSVWVHPHPCHEEIEAVALRYQLTSYITYIETSYIDKPEILKNRFANLIK